MMIEDEDGGSPAKKMHLYPHHGGLQDGSGSTGHHDNPKSDLADHFCPGLWIFCEH